MARETLRSAPLPRSEPPELSLRALRIFVAIEEAGSMAVAAKRLGSSPSSISQQITNLEKAIGAPVFDRRERPLALTPAGLLLRHHARKILETVSAARAELMELSLSTLPSLRLAIIDDLDASITPDMVGHLNKLYPGCLVSASSGRSDTMNGALLRREADILVTAEPPEDQAAFELIPLLREPFILVTARGLVTPDQDVLAQLLKAPFVHYVATMPIARTIDQHLRRLRIVLPHRFAFDATRSLLAMVKTCHGWTLTTPLNLLDSQRFQTDLDVVPLPFAGLSRTIYLAARRDELGILPDKLAELCRRLIDERIAHRVRELAPWTRDSFTVLHPPEPVACAPSAAGC